MTKYFFTFAAVVPLAFACSAPDVNGGDADGDHVVDKLGVAVGAVDLDGDGQTDGTGIDTNGDGEPEGVGLDLDGDGTFEALDTNGDGKPDKTVSSGSGSSGSGGGLNIGTSSGGSAATTDCNPEQIILPVVYRDFTEAHSDFEMGFQGDVVRRGLVKPILGADKKPVYLSNVGCAALDNVALGCRTDYSPTPTEFSSAASFDQWYRDTDTVNIRIEKELVLAPDAAKPGTYSFASGSFFPLSTSEGFGPSPAGNMNNYLFTTEIHMEFGYQAGQKFTFKGDDDVWVFINNKLALELGGMHSEATATIDFDAQAKDLGIAPGYSYAMDVFHAERHTSGSNFRIETNIGCFKPVIIK